MEKDEMSSNIQDDYHTIKGESDKFNQLKLCSCILLSIIFVGER